MLSFLLSTAALKAKLYRMDLWTLCRQRQRWAQMLGSRVVIERACSRLLLKQINVASQKENHSRLTGLWNPKEKGTVVWFTFGTIFCTPDGKLLAEKLDFYCLVTWGLRRRVLSCSLAASNYCTACNKQGRQLSTLYLPSLADRLCFG